MFSIEFYEIFQKTFFADHLRTTFNDFCYKKLIDSWTKLLM